MSNGDYLFTSESVSEGHPDKISDRISDEVVDVYMASGENARVGCETLTTTNRVVMAGEVRGPDSITYEMLEERSRLQRFGRRALQQSLSRAWMQWEFAVRTPG